MDEKTNAIDVPEILPSAGGSYIRHPETGELHPNLDDHVMAARALPAPQVSELVSGRDANDHGGDE